jgi:hypothetical protein
VTAPLHEGWTLLAALAAQTERLRLGLLVSSNRTRPPAVLAKMAATTDLIARGRLIFGIGVGGTRVRGDFRHWGGQNPAIREFEAYGVPLVTPVEGIAALAESCTIIRRMWTEASPFDFDGRFYRLKAPICEPKPVQRPHPTILIGGYGERTLRVIAEHADIWKHARPRPFSASRTSAASAPSSTSTAPPSGRPGGDHPLGADLPLRRRPRRHPRDGRGADRRRGAAGDPGATAAPPARAVGGRRGHRAPARAPCRPADPRTDRRERRTARAVKSPGRSPRREATGGCWVSSKVWYSSPV